MSDNLPPGVTPHDVDEAMRPPRKDRVMGTVTVVVDETVNQPSSDEEARRALIAKVRDSLTDESIDVADVELQERWPISPRER